MTVPSVSNSIVLAANPGGFAKTVHVPMTPPSADGPEPPFRSIQRRQSVPLIQAPPQKSTRACPFGRYEPRNPPSAVVGVALFVLTNAAITVIRRSRTRAA